MKLIHAGGVNDHVHLLLSLARALSISKAMQLIKGGSSKWVHDTFSEHRLFEWQEGYGAFSISISEKQRTVRYPGNQPEHHKKVDFKTEYLSFIDVLEVNTRSGTCLIDSVTIFPPLKRGAIIGRPCRDDPGGAGD